MSENLPTQDAPFGEAPKSASNKDFIKLRAAVGALLPTAATAKNGTAPKCYGAAGKRFSGADGSAIETPTSSHSNYTTKFSFAPRIFKINFESL